MKKNIYNSNNQVIEQEIFNSVFNPRYNAHDDDNHILKNTLKYHLDDSNENFSLNYYFENLFLETGKFKQIKTQLQENIENSIRYHIIHAYGKNGKSTFLRYFEREVNYNVVLFDFSEINLNAEDTEPLFRDKCLTFILDLFSEYKEDTLTGVTNVLNHLIHHTLNDDRVSHGDYKKRRAYNHLFFLFRKEMLASINEYKNEFEGERTYKKDQTFFYKLLIKDPNYRDITDRQLFSLIILTHINLIGNKKKGKVVFILDNLDDIISDSIKFVNNKLSAHLDFFLGIITTYINHDKELKFTKYPVSNNVHFIYSYRSANYANAVFVANTSELERTEFEECKSYLITTVKDSVQILERKCEFYRQNCDKYNIRKSSLYFLLKNILDSFKKESPSLSKNQHQEKEGVEYLMRIWNGNRSAFIDCILAIKDFGYEREFTDLVYRNDEIPKYIKRGVFFNHVIRYFYEIQRGSRTRALTEAIDYSLLYFNNSENIKKCNLFRLFITFVTNNSRSQKNKIKKTLDVLDKGASFFEFMNEISSVKDENNNALYQKDEILQLFRKIFYEEIDSWGYLITCVMDNTYTSNKNTDNEQKELSKYYDFEGLIETYYSGDKRSYEFKKLNQVRIYINDSGYFLTSKLKRHYEFFNITNLKGKNSELSKPIPLLLIAFRRSKHINCILNKSFVIKFSFEFEKDLDSTVERVIDCTMKTVDSFINNSFSDSPKTFCTKSSFSYKANFYFADVISKSITYLEQIRQAINDGHLKMLYKENKSVSELSLLAENSKVKITQDFNSILLTGMDNLINSFLTSFDKINQSYPGAISKSLVGSKKSMDLMKKNISKVVDSGFTDLEIKIQTYHNKDE